MAIELIQYNPEHHTVSNSHIPEDILLAIQHSTSKCVNWVDIDILQRDWVEAICKNFGVHELLIEDIFNHNHLPKYEFYEDYCFMTLKMLSVATNAEGLHFIQSEQVSILMGSNWVLTVQEIEGDIFGEVRHRLAKSLGNLRKRQSDYLFYRLIDTTVDFYFVVLEFLREQIEDLEVRITAQPELNIAEDILFLKSQLRTVRKYVQPLRIEINRLRIEPPSLIHKNNLFYFNDLNDHLVMLESSFETSREMLNDLTDLHLSYLSHSTNQVMKTLSVVSTIFIPLTFIAGVYGMNFEFMPELEQVWAYPALLGFMLSLAIILIWLMKRKRWF
jgi:magnesium transporter